MARYVRYSSQLTRAASLLAIIKECPDRLNVVHELQRLLIRSVVHCERRITRLKRARLRLAQIKTRNRLPRDKARALKALLKGIGQRIEDMRQLLFLWRCFGDGIAAIYQSKYSLKHLFYDSNYNVKEEPGFLLGKKGFYKEYKFFCLGIQMEVPVILSDLTNIIRLGDVCALGGADPVPIEIKSSTNVNARVNRQIEQLQALTDFYSNDGAKNFRGGQNTIRIELKHPEVTHEKTLNECMLEAQSQGLALLSPEQGLHYLSFTSECLERSQYRIDELLSNHVSRTTLFVWLAPDHNWLPLYPFTLSMHTENMIPFIQRNVHVAVLIDIAVLKSHFKANEMDVIVLMDGRYALQICVDPNDLMKGVFRISEQLFLRLAYEFQSLKWFVEEHSSLFLPSVSKLDALSINASEVTYQPPLSWQGLKCLFDEPI